MSTEVPHSPGWYPDSVTGGTRYWDGSAWTGDSRPRRKQFAARARHPWAGSLLLLLGTSLLIIGTLAFWMQRLSLWIMFRGEPEGTFGALARAVQDAQGVDFSQALATFTIETPLGVALAALGVYLLRGQGPTTWSVRERLSARDEEEWLSRQAPTFSGWYANPNANGTAYWDGSDWTGDTRPPRKWFAARASHRHLIPLVLMGGGGWGVLCIGAAFEDGFGIGWFLIGVAALAAVALGCVYLLRGRGPSTEAVKRRLAPVESQSQGGRRGGFGTALLALGVGLVIGAAARSGSEEEEDTYEYLPVPSGLARKKWSFDEGTPVLAMRGNRNGDIEVTLDGTDWEDPTLEPDHWIGADGRPHEWQ